MSTFPLYSITLDNTFEDVKRTRVESYVIDRVPQGPLADYVEMQDARTACDPCMGGLNSERSSRPNRWALLLPDAVSRMYQSSRQKSRYVNFYTLPGFLSWLQERGYETVDLKHVIRSEHTFFIQYVESSNPEFPRDALAIDNSQQHTRQPRSLRVVTTPSPLVTAPAGVKLSRSRIAGRRIATVTAT